MALGPTQPLMDLPEAFHVSLRTTCKYKFLFCTFCLLLNVSITVIKYSGFCFQRVNTNPQNLTEGKVGNGSWSLCQSVACS